MEAGAAAGCTKASWRQGVSAFVAVARCVCVSRRRAHDVAGEARLGRQAHVSEGVVSVEGGGDVVRRVRFVKTHHLCAVGTRSTFGTGAFGTRYA